jgi:hypothetical protein
MMGLGAMEIIILAVIGFALVAGVAYMFMRRTD